MKKLIAASLMATALIAPMGTAAWAGGTGGGDGSLVSVGDVDVVDDVCTNININLGVEKNKTQKC